MRIGSARAAALLVAAAAAAALAPRAAFASPIFSDWPSRSVRIIVPSPEGSADDIAARMYAEGLSRRWTRPVLVENKPDADAFMGGGVFTNRNDDHTLLYAPASMMIVGPLVAQGKSHRLDLLPIAPGARSVIVVAVSGAVPARSLKDLVELVRLRPGELSWSAGPDVQHHAFAATLRRHRLDMVRMPSSNALTPVADRSDGHVHVRCDALQAIAGLANTGKVRMLAVTSTRRETMLPEIQTVAEAGFPEMEIESLSGLFGQRNMPPEVRDQIAADMRAVASAPVIHDRLAANGQRVVTGTPAEFAAAIGRQRIRIQQIFHAVEQTNARQ